jgi:hypothetical protein
MQEQVTWNVMRIAMSIPGYLENVAKEQGKQLSKEELQQIADTATPEHYKLTFDNSTHLRLIDENSVRGFHNLFYYKRWNVIAASSKWKFITTDNPVSEWWPNTGIMGATFSQRKHYFAFTPDFLIESVMPEDNRPPIEQLATERVQYSTATEDETMMYNFVLGNFCSRYGYSPGRVEFDEMLAQMESPAAAKRMYDERY